MKNKKILVFGSKGFIGENFCNRLLSNNTIIKPKFLNNSNFNLGDFDNKKIFNIIKKYNFDYIINFHAHTDINYSNINYKYDFYHNCSITHSIIDSLIKNKSKAFFLNIGTATQVGFTNLKKIIDNNFRGKPLNIFDLHKQYNEDFIAVLKKKHKLNATTLRFANVFGSGKTHSKNRGVINKIINRAILEKEITLFGNGNYIRDFIYIEDLIDGIIFSLKNHKKLKKDFYYLTSGKGITFNQFAKNINQVLFKKFKYKAKIKYKKWPKNSNLLDRRSFIGNSKNFIKITGWKTKYKLSDAINHYIKNNKIT